MAAVTNNLETGEESGIATVHRFSGAGLAGAAVSPSSLARIHYNMTRMAWIRFTVAQELAKKSYVLQREGNEYFFTVDPPLDPADIPFAGWGARRKVRLWSLHNSKMECPSFPLTAGGVATAGTCVGADAGQTSSPMEVRQGKLDERGNLRVIPPGISRPVPMREGLTICSSCYAFDGPMGYSNNIFGHMIRHWWLAQCLTTPEGTALAHNVLMDSIARLPTKVDRHGHAYIRLHDSGDFFSPAYARLWLGVASVLATTMPHLVIWAPTRTWADTNGGWNKFWAEELPKLPLVQDRKHPGEYRPNFVVRPSAYNFGDEAPGPHARGNGAGTTSLFVPHAAVGDDLKNLSDPQTQADVKAAREDRETRETRTDWNCQVYSVDSADTTCASAKDFDGNTGCRVCWLNPELRVNYSAH